MIVTMTDHKPSNTTMRSEALHPPSHFGTFTSPVKKTYASSATYSMQLLTCSHTLPLPCSHSGTVPPTLMSSPGWVPTTWTLNLLTRQSTILRGLPLYSKTSTSHIQYVVRVWLLPYYIMCMCTVYHACNHTVTTYCSLAVSTLQANMIETASGIRQHCTCTSTCSSI